MRPHPSVALTQARLDVSTRSGRMAAQRPPGCEPHQGGAEVAEPSERVGVATDAAREGRVDKHRGRPDALRKEIVDQLGIVLGDGDAREGGAQHLSACGVELVEHQPRTGAARKCGEEAGAGGRLENQV